MPRRVPHGTSKLNPSVQNISCRNFASRNLFQVLPNSGTDDYWLWTHPHLFIWGWLSALVYMPSHPQAQILFRLQKKVDRMFTKLNRRDSCKPESNSRDCWHRPVLILETEIWCVSKCAWLGAESFIFTTTEPGNLCAGQHRVVVYDHLPLQEGVQLVNKLHNSFKSALPRTKTRLKRCLA